MKYVTILFVLILFSSACANQASNQENEISYWYTGDFISLVDQRKEPINKEMKVEYTLQMEKFNPIEEIFNKYNSQFSEDNDKYKHVEITKRTMIYEYHNNIRKVVPAENIRESKRLELWINPYKHSEYMIEAVEIYILSDD